MNQQIKIPKYQIVYFFNSSKMGFSNSITVEAINMKQAAEKAKHEVACCYGTDMLKRFTFKEPVCIA